MTSKCLTTWSYHVTNVLRFRVQQTIHESDHEIALLDLRQQHQQRQRHKSMNHVWTREAMMKNVYQIARLALRFDINLDQPIETFIEDMHHVVMHAPTTAEVQRMGNVLTEGENKYHAIDGQTRGMYTHLVESMSSNWSQYRSYLLSLYTPTLLSQKRNEVDHATRDEYARHFDENLASIHWEDLVSHPYWTSHVCEMFYQNRGHTYPYLGISDDINNLGSFRFDLLQNIDLARKDHTELRKVETTLVQHITQLIARPLHDNVTRLATVQNWKFLDSAIQELTNNTLPDILHDTLEKDLIYTTLEPADLVSLAVCFHEIYHAFRQDPNRLLRDHLREYLLGTGSHSSRTISRLVRSVCQSWRFFLEHDVGDVSDKYPHAHRSQLSHVPYDDDDDPVPLPSSPLPRSSLIRGQPLAEEWTLDDLWSAPVEPEPNSGPIVITPMTEEKQPKAPKKTAAAEPKKAATRKKKDKASDDEDETTKKKKKKATRKKKRKKRGSDSDEEDEEEKKRSSSDEEEGSETRKKKKKKPDKKQEKTAQKTGSDQDVSDDVVEAPKKSRTIEVDPEAPATMSLPFPSGILSERADPRMDSETIMVHPLEWYKVFQSQIRGRLSRSTMEKDHQLLIELLIIGLRKAHECSRLEKVLEAQKVLGDCITQLRTMSTDKTQQKWLKECDVFVKRLSRILTERLSGHEEKEAEFKKINKRYYTEELHRFWAQIFTESLQDVRVAFPINHAKELDLPMIQAHFQRSWDDFQVNEKKYVDKSWYLLQSTDKPESKAASSAVDPLDLSQLNRHDTDSVQGLLHDLVHEFETLKRDVHSFLTQNIHTTVEQEYHSLDQSVTGHSITKMLAREMPTIQDRQFSLSRDNPSMLGPIRTFIHEFETVHRQVCDKLETRGWAEATIRFPAALGDSSSLRELIVYVLRCSIPIIWCDLLLGTD